jgi:hypothetical protein
MSSKDEGDYNDSPLMIPAKDRRRRLSTRARAILKATARKKALWDVIDEYTLDAFVELRHALMTGDGPLRFQAADKLAQIWTRMPPRPIAMPSTAQTKEQWEAQAEAAYQDPAVREFLRRKGCVLPKETEKN